MVTKNTNAEKLEFLYRSNTVRLLDSISDSFHLRVKAKLEAQGYKGLRIGLATVMGNMTFAETRLVDIAQQTGITKQAVGQIAKEIEELGYIERVPDSHDGRAKNLVFTLLGQQLIKDSIAAVKEVEHEFGVLIGKEKIKQFESTLQELAEKLP